MPKPTVRARTPKPAMIGYSIEVEGISERTHATPENIPNSAPQTNRTQNSSLSTRSGRKGSILMLIVGQDGASPRCGVRLKTAESEVYRKGACAIAECA